MQGVEQGGELSDGEFFGSGGGGNIIGAQDFW